MKKFAIIACALALAGCAKSDTAADTTAAATPTPAPPAPIKASDVAGTWTIVGKNPANDSTLLTYELVANNDTVWTTTFANGQKNVVHVMSVAGDSIVTHSPPMNSVLRRGVRVETNGVFRLVDGKLVGTTVAHYKGVKTADSVATLRMEGTRKP